MFVFIKKAFFTGLRILSSVNLLTATPLKCISMNNQECKVRTNETRHRKWHETCKSKCRLEAIVDYCRLDAHCTLCYFQ